MAELKVRFSRTRNGDPLVMVDFPGLDADMTPAQLRRLAQALTMAAEDCESGHTLRQAGRLKRLTSYDY